MLLRLLGQGGSEGGNCPSVYATDLDSYVIQGWKTGRPDVVEIPHLLTGFAESDTFFGADMSDTGRGTFTLSGRPIAEAETLNQMTLADNETAIEVPKRERTFYGHVATAE
ncbi:hypothetical protein [Nocardia sp. NPDC051570]|uniref:hypothetical protein n=1 Tax=Nocardia sp. NPDC051570 TaxID=3364324 RepID=UPI00378CCD0F